jgi:integrase
LSQQADRLGEHARMAKGGLQDFQHDLRHTWAGWHVRNGTPVYDLQEMGGWKPKKWCGELRT